MSVKLPEDFIEEMKDLLGTEFPAYLDSFSKDRFYGLRVNTLKISVSDFLKISPFELKPIPWTEDGFYYDGRKVQPGKHPYYFAGLYYLQEPSAMIPAEILPIVRGDRVLDICAAPGGKSTKLICKLQGEGILFSNDISVSRAQALLKNLELFGAGNIVITAESPEKLADRFPEYFDKILIDAPCSGEGMFRKEPSVIRSFTEHGHKFYVDLQKNIVKSALKMLKKGGMLVYSTCTFAECENEEILAYMKEQEPTLRILPIPNRAADFSEGFVKRIPDLELKNAIRIFPHRANGEGHFAALLQKGEKEETTFRSHDQKISDDPLMKKLPKETGEFLRIFDGIFRNGHLELRNEKLFYVPETGIILDGLHILRAGTFIGEVKTGRFEPSEALAMSLRKDEFPNTLDLSLSDDRVLRYLKGETISYTTEENVKDSYVLILLSGFPLGFGKAKNGKIKNKYLPGWRYL